MRCRLELAQGRPEFVVDGVRRVPLLYSTSFLREDQVRLFADLGVDLVSFPCTADHHLYGLARTCWNGPYSFDDSELEERIALVARANPHALLLPRVFMCSPPWWDAAHPEDLVVWEDGSTKRPLFHGATKETVPSLGSDRWRAAMRVNLARLVRRLESGPWKDRILGYMVNSQNSEEWFHWGTMEGYLFDYNPQVARRFREWLRLHYAGDDGALSRAWGRWQSIDSVAIPDAGRRRHVGPAGCRDPVRQRDVIDFSLFFADLIADTISEMAQVVKLETGGKKLFGTFYGYLLELAYHPDGIQNGGHVGLHHVLDDPNVDFLASPSSYARRLPGEGYSMSMGPSFSVNRHGKVFFHENDVRTHVLWDDAGYGRCDSAFETRTIQLREFAHALTHGHGMWWFDMTSGWYDDPIIKDTVRDIVRISRRATRFPRRSVSEIVVVLDAESLLGVSAPPNQLVQLLSQQCLELSRVGAPFDVCMLRDLEDLEGCKLALFPDLFDVDAEKRRRVHGFLERTGATAMFFVAPGVISGSVDFANCEAVSGIAMRRPEQPRFNVVEFDSAAGRRQFGTWFWHASTPMIDDARVEVLGRYVETGEPALARRAMDGWTSVVSGAPAVCGSMLRRLARDAGVHLWIESDDAVYACNTFLAIHARTAGLKEIAAPGTEALFDVLNGVELARRDDRFVVHLSYADTLLCFRGTRSEWEGGTAGA